jgi:hypothetical protein
VLLEFRTVDAGQPDPPAVATPESVAVGHAAHGTGCRRLLADQSGSAGARQNDEQWDDEPIEHSVQQCILDQALEYR